MKRNTKYPLKLITHLFIHYGHGYIFRSELQIYWYNELHVQVCEYIKYLKCVINMN